MIAIVKVRVEVTVRVSVEPAEESHALPLAVIRNRAIAAALEPLNALEVENPDTSLGVLNVSGTIGNPEVNLTLAP